MSGLIVSLSPPHSLFIEIRVWTITGPSENILILRCENQFTGEETKINENEKWGGKREKSVATSDIYVMVPVLELYFHMYSNLVLYYSWISHALQCTCRWLCVIPGLQNSTNSHINSYVHSLPVVVCLWMEQNKNRQQRRSCSGKTPHPNPPVAARSSHRNTIYLIQASVKHG